MCKHILNAQVSIRTQCCRKWYDCPQCHLENEDHPLKKTLDLTMICKKCKKAFRKDLTDFDEADQFCPYCDNEYFIPAVTGNAPAPQKDSDAIQNDNSGPETLEEARLKKISNLDPRMIRDEDLDKLDEELLGFEPDYTTRLG
ncbi:uncharacterized protein SAPINGB_P005031 [Magnusiomyces paraingens]|uniref:CHY-type domain-containing protein n=1 Tax=Magnusiomyces paraingens TaxID=2606893 RepID=A0A5E8BY04_9ASCO|nr:uncharacterized protein SAPINGB_P005031 [Saprochaete ingens]VVT56387.1 unnamed protein product [Saprochaete ingens]